MIEFHKSLTPNSQKIDLMLEECELEHRTFIYDPLAGDHLVPAFRQLNPNYKLPVLVDLDTHDGGKPLTVFESGAILIYLADKTGRFLPLEAGPRSIAMQWLIWQVAGLGPMLGQAGHFVRYAPEGEAYGRERYVKEAHRLFNVMNSRLGESSFLGGGYSIADMACWPWVNAASAFSIDIGEFPAVHAWYERLLDRPAYQRLLSGQNAVPEELARARMTLTAEQWSNAFGDRMHNAVKPKRGDGPTELGA